MTVATAPKGAADRPDVRVVPAAPAAPTAPAAPAAPTAPTGHGTPGPSAAPEAPTALDPVSREVLRYAFAQGTGRSAVAGPTAQASGMAALPPVLPEQARDGAVSRLPFGTTELLEAAAYPAGRVTAATRPVEHALSAAFGLQRAELANPYFEHRPVPSVRSLFPVHAFVAGPARRQVLDVHRHALVDLAGSAAVEPGAALERVLLAGRYTRIPAFYGRLRGTLTELELGIALRSFAVAFELFGVSARLSLPNSGSTLAELGLSPAGEWSWPLTLHLGSDPVAPADDPHGDIGTPATDTADIKDPTLAEAVAVNRAQSLSVDPAPVPLGPGIPGDAAERPRSWAEVFWDRTSGRMPRALTGMSGRARQVDAASLEDAAAWLGVPPPGPLLARVAAALRITAAVQATDGHADGLHDVRDGRLTLRREDPGMLRALEQVYGYRLAPGNGCDVRHASAVWFVSASQRRLVDEFGPGGWTLAQYVAGWLTQALCLNAAAHGLYARPARAFDGSETQRLLGLDHDETVLLSVITGTSRFSELPLDVRL